jgi:hypothetical protein
LKKYFLSNMQSGMISFVVLIISVIMGMTNIMYHASSDYSVYAQQLPSSTKAMGVKVTSPTQGQKVPTGELNVTGISTDNSTTDCHVYIDVNDIKPLQNTTASGPDGQNDYSNWTFTYTKKYHPIVEGTNELTAKLSCINNPANISKWYSVNVTGVATGSDDKNTASLNNGTQQLVGTHNKGDQIPIQLQQLPQPSQAEVSAASPEPLNKIQKHEEEEEEEKEIVAEEEQEGEGVDEQPLKTFNKPQPSQAEVSAASPEPLNKIQKHEEEEEEEKEIVAEEEQEGEGVDEQPLKTFNKPQPSWSTSEQQPLETSNEQPLQTFNKPQPSWSTSEQQPLETSNEQPLQTFNKPQPSEQQPLEPPIHTQGQEDKGPNQGRQHYQDDSMPFVLPFDSNDVISNK